VRKFKNILRTIWIAVRKFRVMESLNRNNSHDDRLARDSPKSLLGQRSNPMVVRDAHQWNPLAGQGGIQIRVRNRRRNAAPMLQCGSTLMPKLQTYGRPFWTDR
jgi:hypothetical protein